ncbi:chitobiase/beta-hexosaminidase C-terminal domain-containing protein, partial [Candidatus Uhrbacteria bacterium]|nr:chitobiase/beta-hexosaminidase C-terminal domain-containing protein [Candidatus Uhrbacteria bacterium]
AFSVISGQSQAVAQLGEEERGKRGEEKDVKNTTTGVAGGKIATPGWLTKDYTGAQVQQAIQNDSQGNFTGHLLADAVVTAAQALGTVVFDAMRSGLMNDWCNYVWNRDNPACNDTGNKAIQDALAKVKDAADKASGTGSLSQSSPNQASVLFNPNASPTFGGQKAVEAKLAVFDKVDFRGGGNVDILAQLQIDDKTICDTTNWTSGNPVGEPNACTISRSFGLAIQRGLTVREAMNQYSTSNKTVGLKPDGIFGFDIKNRSVTGEPNQLLDTYRENFSYRSLVILRKYRVLPVSWELAALYIRENAGAAPCGSQNDGNCTLDYLVRQFNEPTSSFYRMIDPNWVLKLPPTKCALTSYGDVVPETKNCTDQKYKTKDECELFWNTSHSRCVNGKGVVVAEGSSEFENFKNIPGSNYQSQCEQASQSRKWIVSRKPDQCVDEQTCLRTDAQGQCIDENYGYCIEERKEWIFQGDTCPGPNDDKGRKIYDSCDGFRNTLTGRSINVLGSSINTDQCNESNAGCASYSKTPLFGKKRKISTNGYQTHFSDWSENNTVYLASSAQAQRCEADAEGCTALELNGSRVSRRVAPDLFECRPEDSDMDGTTLTKAWYQKEQCQNFTTYCKQEYKGCELYQPLSAGPGSSGVAVAGYQSCPASCVGLDSFIRKTAQFRSAGEIVAFVPTVNANNPLKSCPVDQVGCSEYTNIDTNTATATRGAEQKEYYSRLQYCEVAPKEIPKEHIFVSITQSASGGYETKKYALKRDTDGSPLCAQNEDVASCICDKTIFQAQGINAFTSGTECREFINSAGAVFYRRADKLVHLTEDCHQYRRSVFGSEPSGTAGPFWGSPTLSKQCQKQYVGCREFAASSAGNIRAALMTKFEDGTTEGWTSQTDSVFTGLSKQNQYFGKSSLQVFYRATVATPTVSANPAGTTFTYPNVPNITLATATTGAAIFYTLDGTDPWIKDDANNKNEKGATAMQYTAPIQLPNNKSSITLKAIGVMLDSSGNPATGWDNSQVVSEIYTLAKPAVTFSSDKASFTSGTATLTYSASGAQSLKLKRTVEGVTVDDTDFTTELAQGAVSTKTVTKPLPPNTIMYTLVATNSAGETSQSVTLTYVPPPTITSFTVNNNVAASVKVTKNTNFTLQWNVSGWDVLCLDTCADLSDPEKNLSAYTTMAGTGEKNNIKVNTKTTFKLIAKNTLGAQTVREVEVDVIEPPEISSFTVKPSTSGSAGGSAAITQNESVEFAFAVKNEDLLSMDQGIGSVKGLPTKTVTLSATGTLDYTLTATNALGDTDSKTVTVTVLGRPAISSFSFDALNIISDETVRASWSATYASSLELKQGSTSVATEAITASPYQSSKIITAPPTKAKESKVYTLEVKNDAGASANRSATLNVYPRFPLNTDASECYRGVTLYKNTVPYSAVGTNVWIRKPNGEPEGASSVSAAKAKVDALITGGAVFEFGSCPSQTLGDLKICTSGSPVNTGGTITCSGGATLVCPGKITKLIGSDIKCVDGSGNHTNPPFCAATPSLVGDYIECSLSSLVKPDDEPDNFDFIDSTDKTLQPSTVSAKVTTESNEVVITGINVETPFKVGGDGDARVKVQNVWSSWKKTGTVRAGQIVQVRAESPTAYDSIGVVWLDIGTFPYNAAGDFAMRTRVAPPKITRFSVAPYEGVMTKSKINWGGSVTFTWDIQGEVSSLSIDNGVPAITGKTGTVSFTPPNHGTFTYTLTAKNTLNEEDKKEVIVDVIPDTDPDPFGFTPNNYTRLAPSTTKETNQIQILGTNAPAPVSITNGKYRTGNGSTWSTWTTASGTIAPAHWIQVQAVAPNTYGATTSAKLIIGSANREATFSLSTPPLTTYNICAGGIAPTSSAYSSSLSKLECPFEKNLICANAAQLITNASNDVGCYTSGTLTAPLPCDSNFEMKKINGTQIKCVAKVQNTLMPDHFEFVHNIGLAPSSSATIESNEITVAGLTNDKDAHVWINMQPDPSLSPAPGAAYQNIYIAYGVASSWNGPWYQSDPSNALAFTPLSGLGFSNGEKIKLQMQAPTAPCQTYKMALTVGGLTRTWTVSSKCTIPSLSAGNIGGIADPGLDTSDYNIPIGNANTGRTQQTVNVTNLSGLITISGLSSPAIVHPYSLFWAGNQMRQYTIASSGSSTVDPFGSATYFDKGSSTDVDHLANFIVQIIRQDGSNRTFNYATNNIQATNGDKLAISMQTPEACLRLGEEMASIDYYALGKIRVGTRDGGTRDIVIKVLCNGSSFNPTLDLGIPMSFNQYIRQAWITTRQSIIKLFSSITQPRWPGADVFAQGTSPSPNNATVTNSNIVLSSGFAYTLSTDVYVPVGAKVTAYLQGMAPDKDGSTVRAAKENTTGGVVVSAGQWQNIKLSFDKLQASDIPKDGGYKLAITVLYNSGTMEGNPFYLDNIVLRETQGSIYAIDNSWANPRSLGCSLGDVSQNDRPQSDVGCQAYSNRLNQAVYFSRATTLCPVEMVGCNEFQKHVSQDTFEPPAQNGKPYISWWNNTTSNNTFDTESRGDGLGAAIVVKANNEITKAFTLRNGNIKDATGNTILPYSLKFDVKGTAATGQTISILTDNGIAFTGGSLSDGWQTKILQAQATGTVDQSKKTVISISSTADFSIDNITLLETTYLIDDRAFECAQSDEKCTAYGVQKRTSSGAQALTTKKKSNMVCAATGNGCTKDSDCAINDTCVPAEEHTKQWSVAYFKMTPDDIEQGAHMIGAFEGSSSIKEKELTGPRSLGMCVQKDLGCASYETSSGAKYFKNPGKSLCYWNTDDGKALDSASGATAGGSWKMKRCKLKEDGKHSALACESNDDCVGLDSDNKEVLPECLENITCPDNVIQSDRNNITNSLYLRQCEPAARGCRKVIDPECVNTDPAHPTQGELRTDYGRSTHNISCTREYFLLANVVKDAEKCTSTVNTESGCMLFYDPTKDKGEVKYNSAGYYADVNTRNGNGVSLNDSSPINTSSPDANVLYKVRLDRQCRTALGCGSYTEEIGTDGKKHVICNDRKPCILDSKGKCTDGGIVDLAGVPKYARIIDGAADKEKAQNLLTLSGMARPDYKFPNVPPGGVAQTTGGHDSTFDWFTTNVGFCSNAWSIRCQHTSECVNVADDPTTQPLSSGTCIFNEGRCLPGGQACQLDSYCAKENPAANPQSVCYRVDGNILATGTCADKVGVCSGGAKNEELCKNDGQCAGAECKDYKPIACATGGDCRIRIQGVETSLGVCGAENIGKSCRFFGKENVPEPTAVQCANQDNWLTKNASGAGYCLDPYPNGAPASGHPAVTNGRCLNWFSADHMLKSTLSISGSGSNEYRAYQGTIPVSYCIGKGTYNLRAFSGEDGVATAKTSSYSGNPNDRSIYVAYLPPTTDSSPTARSNSTRQTESPAYSASRYVWSGGQRPALTTRRTARVCSDGTGGDDPDRSWWKVTLPDPFSDTGKFNFVEGFKDGVTRSDCKSSWACIGSCSAPSCSGETLFNCRNRYLNHEGGPMQGVGLMILKPGSNTLSSNDLEQAIDTRSISNINYGFFYVNKSDNGYWMEGYANSTEDNFGITVQGNGHSMEKTEYSENCNGRHMIWIKPWIYGNKINGWLTRLCNPSSGGLAVGFVGVTINFKTPEYDHPGINEQKIKRTWSPVWQSMNAEYCSDIVEVDTNTAKISLLQDSRGTPPLAIPSNGGTLLKLQNGGIPWNGGTTNKPMFYSFTRTTKENDASTSRDQIPILDKLAGSVSSLSENVVWSKGIINGDNAEDHTLTNTKPNSITSLFAAFGKIKNWWHWDPSPNVVTKSVKDTTRIYNESDRNRIEHAPNRSYTWKGTTDEQATAFQGSYAFNPELIDGKTFDTWWGEAKAAVQNDPTKKPEIYGVRDLEPGEPGYDKDKSCDHSQMASCKFEFSNRFFAKFTGSQRVAIRFASIANPDQWPLISVKVNWDVDKPGSSFDDIITPSQEGEGRGNHSEDIPLGGTGKKGVIHPWVHKTYATSVTSPGRQIMDGKAIKVVLTDNWGATQSFCARIKNVGNTYQLNWGSDTSVCPAQ